MDILEYFYENPPKNGKFIDRKLKPSGNKILLKGGLNSGKTTILTEYLQNFKDKEFLYINLDDARINELNFLLNLNDFIKTKGIKALGIDGVKNDFKLQFKCENIIISTCYNSLELEGFSDFFINGFDYEEFIANYGKNYEARTLFSHFLARGNRVKTAFLQDFEITEFLQTKLRSVFKPLLISVISKLALQIHQNFNAYKIYKELKTHTKISKDKIYEAVREFEDINLICFVPHLDEKSSFKRVYFYDFGLKNVLSYEKDPKITVANMVFCELLKLQSKIYFDDKIDFYLPQKNIAIKIEPFLPPELIFLKFKKQIDHFKNLGIKKICIISNANEADNAFEGVRCVIVPFWKWAVTL